MGLFFYLFQHTPQSHISLIHGQLNSKPIYFFIIFTHDSLIKLLIFNIKLHHEKNEKTFEKRSFNDSW